MKFNYCPKMKVRIVTLCNYEEHYHPGHTGTIQSVDDAGQVHVNWDHGGSIALLPLDGDKFNCWMTNEEILKKVKENFKKKRGKWKIEVGMFEEIGGAYDKAQEILTYLETQFTDDEKEKYSFNKVKVNVTPNDKYPLEVTFQR